MSSVTQRLLAILSLALVAAACDQPAEGADPRPDAEAAQVAGTDAAVTGGPRDVEALRAVVAELDDAWTDGDAVRYGALYGDAEWVSPQGAIRVNPTPVYQFLFNGPFRNSTRTSIIRRIAFLTGTVAVLDIDARVTGFGPLPPNIVPWQPGITRGLEKNILVKRDGEWRIVQHQQTAVQPGN